MISNSENLAKKIPLSTQLYSGIGGAVLLTMAASLVGWFSFDRVGNAQSQVNDSSIPEMAAAFEVAEYSSVLVAAAPRLTSAITRKDLESVYDSISDANDALEIQLEVLDLTNSEDQRLARIREHSQTLISIEAIRSKELSCSDRNGTRVLV